MLHAFALRAIYECLSPFSRMDPDIWFDPFVWMNPFLVMDNGRQTYLFKNEHDNGSYIIFVYLLNKKINWSLGSASTAVQKFKFSRLLTIFDMLYLLIILVKFVPWELLKPLGDRQSWVDCLQCMQQEGNFCDNRYSDENRIDKSQPLTAFYTGNCLFSYTFHNRVYFLNHIGS